ncbi:hypothetical protein Cadr_000027113 [Camelus dromedarius]|uniref:Uncharacterized protein n=1 Tax=Camelus dromedarius TaxID=9838 RepID=A0A5N4C4S4_CAMDR|nr:hypothetical protein Cadr_000027113 [Camelus dromedarius]
MNERQCPGLRKGRDTLRVPHLCLSTGAVFPLQPWGRARVSAESQGSPWFLRASASAEENRGWTVRRAAGSQHQRRASPGRAWQVLDAGNPCSRYPFMTRGSGESLPGAGGAASGPRWDIQGPATLPSPPDRQHVGRVFSVLVIRLEEFLLWGAGAPAAAPWASALIHFRRPDIHCTGRPQSPAHSHGGLGPTDSLIASLGGGGRKRKGGTSAHPRLSDEVPPFENLRDRGPEAGHGEGLLL